jgi:hypothetical protein
MDRNETATALHALKRSPSLYGRRARRELTDMPWVSVVGSATVHKSAVIRTKLSARLKQAAALVVTRGASARILSPEEAAASASDAEDSGGARKGVQFGEELLFDDEEAGADRWLVKGERRHDDTEILVDGVIGWTYVFWPQLDALRMPYPALVHAMREALSRLKQEARYKQRNIGRMREIAARTNTQRKCFRSSCMRVLLTLVSNSFRGPEAYVSTESFSGGHFHFEERGPGGHDCQ